MKLKVCGMKYQDNLEKILEVAQPDMIGMIFHPLSSRFVRDFYLTLPEGIKKVGVFVNPGKDYIFEKIIEHDLDIIQLHGEEPPEFCENLKRGDLTIMKAFGIENSDSFNQVKDYTYSCDYLLFDTKHPAHGGSGKRFNWSLLDNYNGKVPFLLSGGIGPNDAKKILSIDHPALLGVDINSRFELEPAVKDYASLKKFTDELFD